MSSSLLHLFLVMGTWRVRACLFLAHTLQKHGARGHFFSRHTRGAQERVCDFAGYVVICPLSGERRLVHWGEGAQEYRLSCLCVVSCCHAGGAFCALGEGYAQACVRCHLRRVLLLHRQSVLYIG